MTDEEKAIVKALRARPLTERQLKAATKLNSLWSHIHDLGDCGIVGRVIYADWPDDDNKLYFLA